MNVGSDPAENKWHRHCQVRGRIALLLPAVAAVWLWLGRRRGMRKGLTSMALTVPINPAVLPVIVSGPIVRRLTRTRVHVWVALSVGDPVQLTIFDTSGNATASATTMPLRIGAALWVAVLSADGVTGGEFVAGSIYEYSLSSPGWPAERAPDWTTFSIQPRTRPSFSGLPVDLVALRVLHASCRRPHANRRDALGLAATKLSAASRPHLCVLSGDQVYADDVATVAAARLRSIADDLVGIDDSAVFGAPPPLAGRQAATNAMGLTSELAKDHVWTLGEFYGLYLLAWSEVLWPVPPLPVLAAAAAGEVDAGLTTEEYDAEVANLELFLAALPAVRRVLANTPTLMIFDDHEVTDDWNLDHSWLTSVYSGAAGRRVVANGLLAYLVFQHWGNDPDRFAAAATHERLALDAAAYDPAGTSPVTTSLETRLGLPVVPGVVPPGGYVARDLLAGVRYDVRLGPADGYPAHVVLLDERTARLLPTDDGPSGRIAPGALDLQWPAPLGSEADTPTLLVAPAPVLGLHLIEHVIQPLLGLREGGPAEFDFESWSAWQPTYEHLLARINGWRRVVILSGDVHFGFTSTLRYEAPPATTSPGRAVQFVCGGAKHSVSLTVLLHLLGDAMARLGIIRTRVFHGYAQLSQTQRDAVETVPAGTLVYDDAADVLLGRVLRHAQQTPAVFAADVAAYYNLDQPDWAYTIEAIDDESLPAGGNLLTALNTTPAAWTGWDRAKSIATVRGLRANDLLRIGRVTTGLPQSALITFPSGQPLRAHQDLHVVLGDDEQGPVALVATEAVLG
jgi:hypothetical protein